MSLVFPERALAPERMDTEPLDGPTTERILSALENVNAWLGGVHATMSVLKGFSKRWQAGKRIRFIDWGTGSADIPRAIVRWCRRLGFRAEVLGIDQNRAIVEYARRACRDYPEITLLQTVAKDFPDPHEPFDYALSSLCLHHLSNLEVIQLLARSHRITSRGMIMNDLKRSARAWAWIWGLTRILRAHPIVQNDAPLSVRNAFTKKELEALAREAGLPYLKVATHFGYRFTLAGEKI
jgi:2-polyprenyl-3-methyl-5-hydroxy-6-metoxy-1,4-benzoquinol methylase